MLTVGSLFSGIGGFDLGLERAGHAVRWQIEVDQACQQVLGRHFGHGAEPSESGEQRSGPARHGDIRTIRELAAVDLICGGFPCQDLSVAGKRAGLAGERSGLWHEFRRVVAELTPGWVLVENVPGLLSSNGGADFAVVLRGLVELGYGVAWRILDAQYFGVAQRRRRVFVIGCLGSAARAAAVLFEPESCDGDTPPSRATREGPAASLTSGSGVGSNDPGRRREDDVNLVPETTGTLAQGAHPGSYNGQDAYSDMLLPVAHTLRSEGGDASEDGTGRGTPLLPIQYVEQWGRDKRQNGMGIGDPGDPSFTLDASYPHGFGMGAMVRRLTPVECERLQGFPDGWTAGQSDSVRYRQLGNAICVPVAEWIGRRMA